MAQLPPLKGKVSFSLLYFLSKKRNCYTNAAAFSTCHKFLRLRHLPPLALRHLLRFKLR